MIVMNIPKYSKDSRLKSLILLAISLISSSRFDRRAFTIKYCFMSLSSLSSSLNLLGEIGFDKEDAIKIPPWVLQSSTISWKGVK